MKSVFLLLIVFLTGLHSAHAQYDYDDTDLKKPKLPKEKRELSPDRLACKLALGGGLYLSFGDHTSFAILPKIKYKPVDYFELVVGFGYQFDSYKTLYDNRGNAYQLANGEKVKTNAFNIPIKPRFYIWKNLFAQATYAYSIVDVLYGYQVSSSTVYIVKRKESFNNIFLGAGYKFSFGDGKFEIPLALMVNVNKNALWPTHYIFPEFEFFFYPWRGCDY